ncbi:PREDICTED: glycerol-3-phosphate acyltransferase 1, mitochondrial isoform X1 [Nicrophorus vespilloides]|uniref:Glycerol-3-phosphate acyltransferase 1, mitochondrial isoform X1 n=2 Tax=Nicrophorus vespilloides TaxID=110193 RepID=A0ABM1MUJ7_NICVS|nr:PREDICTED: glycerol-3-phosphate acyltransferase 1, mitochondrial isoform X1 [Nicrophorus vespilloides]
MELIGTLYGAFQLTIVVFFVHLVLIVKGINKMVDVLSRRIIDTYNRFAPRDPNQNESISSISYVHRVHKEQKFKKPTKQAVENLFAIKEDVPPVTIAPRRQYPTNSQCNCNSRGVTKPTPNLTNCALKNILKYTPAQKNINLLNRVFNHLSQVYELKKYTYPQVEGTVIKDERVKHAIEKMSVQQFRDTDDNDDEVYNKLLSGNKKRAAKLLRDMRSKLSDFLLRFTSWVLYKLFPCFLKAVVVHPAHVQMLKEASKSNLPMIFLPLHRSHLDYILMSFILLNNDIRSPLVASGDNLRIPFFGSLLRGLGAFFIKRRVDPIMGRKDHIYKAILHTYMNECLRAGHNIEFFLEGGRTRTGKPCMPKYGILSVIVEAVIDGTIEDALLVPVSINYEKLVDGNFVREQLGQAKEMETFGSAIKGIWQVLNSNYGMIRVDFNQPFSLTTLINTFNTNGKIPKPIFNKKLKSNPSSTSLYGTDVVSDEHKNIVESISKHVIYDCANTQAIMSTNAVAFLLLNKYKQGVSMQELVDALDELKTELIAKNREIGFTGDYLDVINYAIEILGPALVMKEKGPSNEDFIKPVSMLPNVIELSYYSNSLMSCYSLDSVIAIALFSLDLKSGIVEQDDLVQASLELCNYLQYEFIFCRPCQSLESNILEAIDCLRNRHHIFTLLDSDKPAQVSMACLDIDDEERVVYNPVQYQLNAKGKEYAFFLRSLLMPLIEAYSVTASSLYKLVDRTVLENELVKDILEEMKSELSSGSLLYEESVSVDPIKNALKLYQRLELLEVHTEKKLKLYYLKENVNNNDSVKKMFEKIDVYRSTQKFDVTIFSYDMKE